MNNTAVADREQDENGESFIPASQRPDGTWRKARRVKEGYVPQEEVPLYESKGKKFVNRQLAPAEPVRAEGKTGHRTIPGLFIDDKEKPAKAKKKTKKIEEITTNLSKVTLGSQKKSSAAPAVDTSAATDPAKKLKNLKKRLREVEALEAKVKSGEIAKPEAEQLAKIKRKQELALQIAELEK